MGLLPAKQRPLDYLTTRKAPSPSHGVSQLQPIFSRTRSLKQANIQPEQSAGSQRTPKTATRPGVGAKTFPGNRPTKTQQASDSGHDHNTASPMHVDQVCQPANRSSCHPPPDSQLDVTGSGTADVKSETQSMWAQKPCSNSDTSMSPKRNFDIEQPSQRRSNRRKPIKTD